MPTLRSPPFLVPIAAALVLADGARAAGTETADAPAWQPSTVFAQLGAAEHARMMVIGATWDWPWHRRFSVGSVSGYWEASIGRWSADGEPGAGSDSAWVTQLGITPVLRLHPTAWSEGWFVEAGIGVNVLAPIYRNGDKRFSTAFNFGDHFAVGRRFGEGLRHEIALRLQHFSNAGIRHPNPGENFLQLRYSLHL